MKIQDSNLTGLGGAGGAGRANGPNTADAVGHGRGKQGGSRTEKSEDGDSIQLSSLSQELRAEESDSPDRLARIDQLRSDVLSGRYQPDSLQVSKAIVKDAVTNRGAGSPAPTGGPAPREGDGT